MDTTSDVRIWRTDVYKGSRGNTHYVRWGVGEKRFEELFKTAALAESFHSRLISAARSGEAFSVRTGLPVSMHRDDTDSSWHAFACGEHHPAQTRCAVQRHGVRRGEEDPGVESTPVRRAQAEPRHAGTGGPASCGQPGPGATPPGRRRQSGRQRPRAGRVLRLSLLLCAAAGRGRRSHGERTGDPAGGVGGAVPARVGAQDRRGMERQRSPSRQAGAQAPVAGVDSSRALSAAAAAPAAHLREYGTNSQGQLFHATRDPESDLSDSVYGRVWAAARIAAPTPGEAASPLAGRPYDLRHAAVWTWLNTGVPPPQARVGRPRRGRARAGLRQVHRRPGGRRPAPCRRRPGPGPRPASGAVSGVPNLGTYSAQPSGDDRSAPDATGHDKSGPRPCSSWSGAALAGCGR